MSAPKIPLRQQLELLRLRGARHRLQVAVAAQALRQSTDSMRRTLDVALSLWGCLPRYSAQTRAGRTGLGRTLLSAVLRLLAASRGSGPWRGLRAGLETATLVLLIYRRLRRARRKDCAGRAS